MVCKSGCDATLAKEKGRSGQMTKRVGRARTGHSGVVPSAGSNAVSLFDRTTTGMEGGRSTRCHVLL